MPFPTALDILNTLDEVLREVGISHPKVLYLKDLAQKVLDGLPTLADLEAMDDEAIIQTLIQVKGIGRSFGADVAIDGMCCLSMTWVSVLAFAESITNAELPDKKEYESILIDQQC